MGVYTFVCRSSRDEWTGKQLSGHLEASAPSTYDLQRKLVQTALSVDSSGGVSTSFSIITPSYGVFQVVVGGGAVGGSVAAAAAAPGGGSAPAAEEKKEEALQQIIQLGTQKIVPENHNFVPKNISGRKKKRL